MGKSCLGKLTAHMEEMYDDIVDDVVFDLRKTDSDYSGKADEILKMQALYPFLSDARDTSKGIHLSPDEYAALFRYMALTDEVRFREMKAYYFRGHKDNYVYMRLIGLVE